MAAGRMVYVRATKKTKPGSGHWAESKKIEALTFWMANGSVTETARQCNIPYETVKSWKESDWWKDRVKQIQNEDYDKLDTKLTKAIDKALDNLMDRIEHGESMYDPKTGKVRKMPAKLRDLNVAFNTIMDKRQLIRKQPTKIVEQQSTAAQLQNLANQFAAFVSGKKPTESIKDITQDFIEGENVLQAEDGTYHMKEFDGNQT